MIFYIISILNELGIKDINPRYSKGINWFNSKDTDTTSYCHVYNTKFAITNIISAEDYEIEIKTAQAAF